MADNPFLEDPFADDIDSDTQSQSSGGSALDSSVSLAPPLLPPRPAPKLPPRPQISNSSPSISSPYLSTPNLGAMLAQPVVRHPNTGLVNRQPPTSIRSLKPDLHCHQSGKLKSAGICGPRLVTLSQHLRSYDTGTGENTSTMQIAEQKINCFEIVSQKYVWAGTDKGELVCFDQTSGHQFEKRVLHTCAVSHILLANFQIYTLDENGGLKVWSALPGEKVSLIGGKPRGLRVTAKLSYILADGNYLWGALAKSLEIFNLDANANTIVVKRIDTGVGGTGLVSGISMLPKLGLVFLAHEDGKISVYSNSGFDRVAIIAASIYKITAILGVGDEHLWVGYSTGKINIFHVPTWSLVKDFLAYPNSGVTQLFQDPFSAGNIFLT